MADRLKNTMLVLLLTLSVSMRSQDTFSILAFDSITREVGAAGASCVDLFANPGLTNHFIAELFPDTGAVVTQAAYISANQVNARARMRAGDSAIAVLRWLQANDAIGSPFNNKSHRQYGAVKLGEGSAAYTGSNCMTYANHITGPNYCIQGNILLGKAVLDSMEARFLRAEGDLACRLMAAMQGAKMVGADTRCAQNNSSSLFAFLKVTLPADTFGKPSLLVSLKTHQGDSIEPIDSLQVLFDAVRTCTVNTTGLHRALKENGPWMFPNPAAHEVVILPAYDEPGTCRITDLCGQTVFFSQVKDRISVNVRQWPRGVYQVEFRSDSGTRVKRLVLD